MNLLDMFEDEFDNESSDGKNERLPFTKFEEGNTYITVLAAALPRWTHYLAKNGRLTVTCPGNGCPVCAIIKSAKKNDQKTDHSSAKKFGMLVYNHNTNQLEILDQRKTFAKNLTSFLGDLREEAAEEIMEEKDITLEEALKEVDHSVYDPSQFVIRVKREGTGKNDTAYTFKKAPKSQQKEVPEEILEKVKELDINDLFLSLSSENLKKLLSGMTLKEIFNPEDSEESEEDVSFEE